MKFIQYSIIAFFILNFNLLNAQDKNSQIEITKNLRCLVCQGQSVYDSDSEFANSVKIIVKKKLNNVSTFRQMD